MKQIIANVVSSPAIRNAATTVAKFADKARKAVRAGVDSWNTIPDAPRELSEKDQLGIKLCNIMADEAIRGTLTQRTARALNLADEYVSERRVLRTWRYVVEANAVECLTSSNLRDIVQVIRHCEVDLTAQATKDKNQQLCKELLELADKKDGMRLEEALAFGQPAAEEIILKRFRAMQAQAQAQN